MVFRNHLVDFVQSDSITNLYRITLNISKLEEKNISLKTADIGIIATEDDEKTTMDEEQLVKIIREHDPNILVLSFCYTDINELNTILRSEGLYADLIIGQDHSDAAGVNKGKLIEFDPVQREVIDAYMSKMPKTVMLMGHFGAGKTLIGKEVDTRGKPSKRNVSTY